MNRLQLQTIRFQASGLSGGKKECMVDFSYEVISKIIGKSIFTRHTTRGDKVYAFLKLKNKTILLSRYLMGVVGDPTVEVDHKNGNSMDNRICNLRICSRTENAQSRKVNRNSKTGFRGVTVHSRKYQNKDGSFSDFTRYRAILYFNKKTIYLGYFRDPEEAAYVYDQALIQMVGSQVRTNFIYDDNDDFFDNPSGSELTYFSEIKNTNPPAVISKKRQNSGYKP